MPLYECVFIARQDISAPQVDALADALTAVVAENGGEVKKREYWGLRSLAYRIKKNRKGHYVLFNIDAPAKAVHEMERQLGLHEDVLRSQTVRVDELEEGPSAILQGRDRADRPERPGRRDDRDRPRRDDRPGRDDRPSRDDRPRREEPTEGGVE